MIRMPRKTMNIRVVDVGGSHIKCLLTGRKEPRKFESGPEMTPGDMVKGVLTIAKGWRFDAVSIGYPGVVCNGVIQAMELGHLRYGHGRSYEDYLGKRGLQRLGKKKWRRKVGKVTEGFRQALLPDDIVLGGGNVKKLKHLPPQTRRGGNADAFEGGFRLWKQANPIAERETA